MPEHVITVDTPAGSHCPTDDYAARAYCTDECGWAGAWHHVDTLPSGYAEHPDVVVTQWAEADGAWHLADVRDA